MTNPITPNDILDIVDYTKIFPLFISATTNVGIAECNVPKDKFIEWAERDWKLYEYVSDDGGKRIELEDYIFANYGSHQARELIEFCLTFYPNLITIR